MGETNNSGLAGGVQQAELPCKRIFDLLSTLAVPFTSIVASNDWVLTDGAANGQVRRQNTQSSLHMTYRGVRGASIMILEFMRVGRGREAVAGGDDRCFRSHSPSM